MFVCVQQFTINQGHIFERVFQGYRFCFGHNCHGIYWNRTFLRRKANDSALFPYKNQCNHYEMDLNMVPELISYCACVLPWTYSSRIACVTAQPDWLIPLMRRSREDDDEDLRKRSCSCLNDDDGRRRRSGGDPRAAVGVSLEKACECSEAIS